MKRLFLLMFLLCAASAGAQTWDSLGPAKYADGYIDATSQTSDNDLSVRLYPQAAVANYPPKNVGWFVIADSIWDNRAGTYSACSLMIYRSSTPAATNDTTFVTPFRTAIVQDGTYPTWDRPASGTFWIGGGDFTTPDMKLDTRTNRIDATTGAWHMFDITSTIQCLADSNYDGFAISLVGNASTANVDYHSAEGTSLPYIIIHYTAGGATAKTITIKGNVVVKGTVR